jgi:hypothetical protein
MVKEFGTVALFMGNTISYYYFFANIEITTTLFIMIYAFPWIRTTIEAEKY